MFQLSRLKCGCQQDVFYPTIPPSFWCFLLNHSYYDFSIDTTGNGSYTPLTGFKPSCPSHKLSSKGQQKFMSQPSTSQREALLRNWWQSSLQEVKHVQKLGDKTFGLPSDWKSCILIIKIILLRKAFSIKS